MTWHYVRDGKESGPVEVARLAGMIKLGELPRNTLVWRPGQPSWLAADTVAEIAEKLPAPARPTVTIGPAGPVQFRCPYCQSTLPPLIRKRVSGAGWTLFILLFLFTCAIFCWFALLIQEEYRICASCGTKLG